MVIPPVAVRTAFFLLLAALCTTPTHAQAQSSLPPERLSLESLAAFQPPGPNWTLAGAIAGDPRREKQLTLAPGTGVVACNPGTTRETRTHLFSAWEHGDLELELEFLLTPRSNSGVYLQGRYEVQLFDSWGVRNPTAADCGGIYQRWDAARGAGKEGYEGHAPRTNAARAPGLWQTLHIAFQGPRFDATGKKVQNARFIKVVLNGFTIHENVEVTGPTRSGAFNDEKPVGPLMFQGDHGSVAFRNIAVKRFGTETIAVNNLRYKLYAGDYKQIGDYDKEAPQKAGTPERFSTSAVETSGKFALVFTGSLVVPRAGTYRFAIESGSRTRLQVSGRDVVTPLDRGSQPGTIELSAGPHDFRLDQLHPINPRPTLALTAEGPGIAPQTLTVSETNLRARPSPKRLIVEPTDRIQLQRGFVPFEPRKRLYAASVGTPAGVHYAYDFETGALLRAWRGSFIDTVDMWEGRGNDQVAKAQGPALTFNAKPAVSMIEYAQRGDWPDQPEALWSSQGYTLEPDGQPVFLSQLAGLAIRDRIAPAADARGLTRTLNLSGSLPSWSTWVLLAEAETITAQPDGHGYIIGEREWYLDWPAATPRPPVLRSVNGKQQLAVLVTPADLTQPITYSIIW
jgi:hypothetical protein